MNAHSIQGKTQVDWTSKFALMLFLTASINNQSIKLWSLLTDIGTCGRAGTQPLSAEASLHSEESHLSATLWCPGQTFLQKYFNSFHSRQTPADWWKLENTDESWLNHHHNQYSEQDSSFIRLSMLVSNKLEGVYITGSKKFTSLQRVKVLQIWRKSFQAVMKTSLWAKRVGFSYVLVPLMLQSL